MRGVKRRRDRGWRFSGKFSQQKSRSQSIPLSSFAVVASTGVLPIPKANQAIHMRHYFCNFSDSTGSGSILMLDPPRVDITNGTLAAGPCLREYSQGGVMATGAAPTPSGLFLPGPPASLTVELTDDWLEWDDYIEVGGMLGANLTYTGVTLFRNSDAGAAHTVAVLETAMWDVYELTFNIDRVKA